MDKIEEGINLIAFDPEDNGVDVTMKLKKLREDMYVISPGEGGSTVLRICIEIDQTIFFMICFLWRKGLVDCFDLHTELIRNNK